MRYLSKSGKKAIQNLIASGDRHTSGRFIAVIADSSGRYSGLHMVLAMLFFLTIPLISFVVTGSIPESSVFLGITLVVVALFLTLGWTKLGVRLVPKALRKHWCQRKARQYFISRNLPPANTSGTLFAYVSAAEDYIVVLADNKVSTHVSEDVWSEICARTRTLLRQGQVQQAMTFVSEACLGVLTELFPKSGEIKDEAASEFITIKSH